MNGLSVGVPKKREKKKSGKRGNDSAFATKRRQLALLAVECLLFPVPVSNGALLIMAVKINYSSRRTGR